MFIPRPSTMRATRGSRHRAVNGRRANPGATGRRTGRRTKGFTLIEIMMVIVILGILGVLIVPNIIGRGDQARRVAAESDLRAIANALDLYRLDNGVYPSTTQGLNALVSKPSGFPEPRRWGPEPYLKKAPVDAWGNPFVYVNEGRNFELRSLGADGAEGGEGIDADINLADI